MFSVQWGRLSNMTPGLVIFSSMSNVLGHPPLVVCGVVAILVLDEKCGNGHGNWGCATTTIRIPSEWASARACERASPGTF